MAKIKIDENLCIGCGLCASLCPKVFEMDDGKAVVKLKETKENCREAEENCPTQAIKMR